MRNYRAEHLQSLKERWSEYREAQRISDELDEALENDPENIRIERKWDNAYKATWDAMNLVLNELGAVLVIPRNEAYELVMMKEDELDDLIQQIA